jgi:hypothetical protein
VDCSQAQGGVVQQYESLVRAYIQLMSHQLIPCFPVKMKRCADVVVSERSPGQTVE